MFEAALSEDCEEYQNCDLQLYAAPTDRAPLMISSKLPPRPHTTLE